MLLFVVAVLSGMMPFSVSAAVTAPRDPILQQAMELVKTKNYTAAIDTVTQNIAQGKLAGAEQHGFIGGGDVEVGQQPINGLLGRWFPGRGRLVQLHRRAATAGSAGVPGCGAAGLLAQVRGDR